LRRRLRSAERLSDRAMRLGSFQVNTPRERSSASLVRVTRADQRRPDRAAGRRAVRWRAVALRAIFLGAMAT
jgi:hypothetical protein